MVLMKVMGSVLSSPNVAVFPRDTLPVLQCCALMLFLALGMVGAPVQAAEDTRLELVVAEPFLSLRSGPGGGYPVIHTLEQGERFRVERRRTDWVKVSDDRGNAAWARFSDIQKTRFPDGSPAAFQTYSREDFRTRRFEFGYTFGQYDGDPTNSLTAGWWWSQHLIGEATLAQSLGDDIDRWILNVAAGYSPYPQRRLSPYLSLGAGLVKIDPEVLRAGIEKREEAHLNAGLGLRWWLADRYSLRAEYRGYLVLSDSDQNDDAQEWKLGLSIGF